MKKKNLLILFISIFLVSGVVAVTLALTTIQSSTTNSLTMTSLKAEIQEIWEKPDSVYPGETITKKVGVKNTGTTDILVRIKLDKIWGDTRDSSGNLIKDQSLDPDNIIINFNNEYWVDGKDGYYYYLGTLKSGESTVENLFDSFTINSAAGSEYATKTVDIIVNMEVIQSEGDAPEKLWGKSYAFLNIEKPNNDIAKTTSVTLINETDKFDIELSKTDLFSNFKDLVPGVTRTQNVVVKNNYSKDVEILLKAEESTQEYTPETKELIDELLKEYAIITVTDSANTVIYKGPVWGNLDSDTDTMKNYISLGDFNTGDTKTLKVSLSLDSSMDNKYQSLLGKVDWVFEARYIDYFDLTISKAWKDTVATNRPDSIKVTLYKDNVKEKDIILSNNNNWTETVNDLDSGANYTVDEESVPTGYNKSINCGTSSCIITNTEITQPNPTPGSNEIPKKDGDTTSGVISPNTATGSTSLIISLAILLLSFIAMFITGKSYINELDTKKASK